MEGLTGATLGNYRVLEKVGQGGMTSVYRAVELEWGREVALKVLSPYIAQDSTFRARFAREVEVLRGLRHPHIVPILDYEEGPPYAYLVLPYYPGGTLADRVRTHRFTPAEVGRLVDEIGAALAHAHAHGVVHRDVKPSNILLDDDGRALLSDFGFAHLHDQSLSLTGSAVVGTPAYMAPEQCRGEPVDARADLYALGVVLYQLFTGRLPYEGETPLVVLAKHLNEPLPPPRAMNPLLPEPMEAVLLRALEKDPADRYPSMEAFVQAFHEALDRSFPGPAFLEPILIGEPTAVFEGAAVRQVTGAPARRRRLAAIAALLLLLGLTGGAWGWSSLRARQETPPAVLLATPTGLAATLRALETAASGAGGTPRSPEEVQTAVAATVTAMGFPAGALATPTPSPTPSASASPTATATSAAGFLPSATPTPQPPLSFTATPTPPPPTATPRPPTDTPPPPPPTATSTPKPINPNACKDDPQHPNYCTPTPEG